MKLRRYQFVQSPSKKYCGHLKSLNVVRIKINSSKSKSKKKSYQYDALLRQNQELKKEKQIYQEYFQVFQMRYKQKKKENNLLKEQLNYLRTSSREDRQDLTTCYSDRNIKKKLIQMGIDKAKKLSPTQEC